MSSPRTGGEERAEPRAGAARAHRRARECERLRGVVVARRLAITSASFCCGVHFWYCRFVSLNVSSGTLERPIR